MASATVPLLQQLIRNACVNDGTAASGHESRNAEAVAQLVSGPGVEVEVLEKRPGRASLVARIEGSDPTAPSLCWMAHTDVVPANPDEWRRDPFGGELVDGEVWGRGAVDMLNLAASMAVAFRTLADRGFRPRGTLVLAAVADEESGGDHGARFLTSQHLDAVRADYCITESGGVPVPTSSGTALPVMVAERGSCWPRLLVSGTSAHGSLPYAADSAIVTAAEVLRRLVAYRPPIVLGEVWRDFVAGLCFAPAVAAALLDEGAFDSALSLLPPGLAAVAHSSTRPTMAPTVISGGSKANTIPDRVEIQLDVRTLPGQGWRDVERMLDEALDDLRPRVRVLPAEHVPGTQSPRATPLWGALGRAVKGFHPDGYLVPMLAVGGTDNRWMRPTGAVGYGFGLFSRRTDLDALAAMTHGKDERVDVESLDMLTDMWGALARDLLG